MVAGTLHIISDWYVAKAGAQAEYEDMRYMRYWSMEGKAFIVRRAIKVLPDGTTQGPMLGPFDCL